MNEKQQKLAREIIKAHEAAAADARLPRGGFTNAREYLQGLDPERQVTFVIRGPALDSFRPASVRRAWDWLVVGSDGSCFGEDLLVINPDHPPIDGTGHWVKEYEAGRLSCATVSTEADLWELYGPELGFEMIGYYQNIYKK